MVSTNILCIIQWFKQTNLCIYQCKIFIKKKILLSICASAEQYDRCWVINVPSNKNCDFFSMGEFSALISTFHPASCYDCKFLSIVIITVQLLSRFWIFAIPWTEAHQASLSFSIAQNLLKLMSIESMMLSNHLILCIYLSSHLYMYILFWALFHYSLLQDIEYSSLCYCDRSLLFILYIIAGIC